MSSIGFYWSRLNEDERIYVLNVVIEAPYDKCKTVNLSDINTNKLLDMKIIESRKDAYFATNETKEFLNTLLNVEYFDVTK